MNPFSNPPRLAISSAYGGGAEHPEQTGSGTLNDQTYFVGHLNVSCNSNDSAGYFDMPEYVTDMYLQALDGGDESNAALRQISGVYGPKEDEDQYDINFNHNVNPEPCPNEGCGCTFSYNGGAGAGTATCDDCCCSDGKPYESGFKDKKRDPACCCCQDDTYQKGLTNKKPCCEYTTEYKYVPDSPQIPVYCPASDNTCCGNPSCKKKSACDCEDTYQRDLCNKKPECTAEYKYVPELPPPPPYCSKCDKSCCCSSNPCCPGPDTYELIRNTDAQRYKGKGPDRSNFYADDKCDCPPKRCNNSCNNNLLIVNADHDLDWAQVRRAAYNITPTGCPSCSPTSNRRAPSSWMDEFSNGSLDQSAKGKNVVNMSYSPAYVNNLAEQPQPVLEAPYSPSRLTAEPRRPVRLSNKDQKTEEEEEKQAPPEGRCMIS